MSLSSSHPTVEVKAAFETFLDRGARGRDWPSWSALFTDNAIYTEHCMGQFHGASGIEEWITAAMQPVAGMTFSVEWSVIEGDLVAFWIWNHLPNPPASAREFCFPNLSILTYAEDGRWSAEEDFYEPAWTGCVIDWYRAGGSPAMSADPTLLPRRPSHPVAPATGPSRAVVSAALAAAAPASSILRHDIIGRSRGIGVFDTDQRAYAVIVHVDNSGTTVFTDTVTNPTEVVNPCYRYGATENRPSNPLGS